jgi:hypothetical protein
MNFLPSLFTRILFSAGVGCAEADEEAAHKGTAVY